MRMYDIIESKRDGKELTEEEIRFFIDAYTNEQIPDYQISALLMATYFQGMTERESAALTMAMVHSGSTIDLSEIKGIKVDKHSTGGVGDTTTLILAPLVASAGVVIPKMSGRGLGHTGGTIDKLESIRGFHTELTNEQFIELVNKHKLGVIGQSGNLTPADKKLYSLRDVTATVNSIPLIASSIMSKKIAAGADAIVLDVKTGSGAFMKNLDMAKKLAQTMVSIGKLVGKETVAIISDMSQPLGHSVGNALEVKEAIETLQGNGPEDLTELCLTLGSQMLLLAKKASNAEEARETLIENMKNGKALQKFIDFIEAQGGDATTVTHPEQLPQAKHKIVVKAQQSGVVQAVNADEIGKAAMMLGAGRITKNSKIDLAVGVVLHKKIGDSVIENEALATIHSSSTTVDAVNKKILNAMQISDKPKKQPILVYETIMC
ncbi:pyrimidine-nucleoside phosphorylase [Virgibacillus sp. W0430]|uniref:pyrimidine-nucleoside phosphorylase n=1 Tax=Virgibacillus sp. W0430 TaxID=3391580 RepID=UPI003F47C2B4